MGKDQDQFWQLVEQEHTKARAFCLHLTGNNDDGDDLYQDAVMIAHRGFGKLRSCDSFRPWLFRIIGNCFKARFRNPWWRRMIPMTGDESIEPTEDPSGRYEARRILDHAFGALSAEDRFIVTLADLEGWKHAELAEMMSKTEGFIKMRLVRARRKMRKRLAAKYSKSVEAENELRMNYAVSKSSRDTE